MKIVSSYRGASGVQAIKALRASGYGLSEAKDIIDSVVHYDTEVQISHNDNLRSELIRHGFVVFD